MSLACFSSSLFTSTIFVTRAIATDTCLGIGLNKDFVTASYCIIALRVHNLWRFICLCGCYFVFSEFKINDFCIITTFCVVFYSYIVFLCSVSCVISTIPTRMLVCQIVTQLHFGLKYISCCCN